MELPQHVCCPRPFSEGLAAVRFIPSESTPDEEPYLGYIDRTGKFVIPPKFIDTGNLEGEENFSEGLAVASPPGAIDNDDDYLYGYIDKSGEIVIPPKFNGAHPFSDGLAVVEMFNGNFTSFAFINRKGEIVFEHSQAYDALNASEGLAAIQIDSHWGFIDGTGKFVIEPQFSSAGRFSNGLAPVRDTVANKYGYIDRIGKFVIPPQFAEAQPFSEGLAAVKVNQNEQDVSGQWGYIDTTGLFIIPPQFQDTFPSPSSFSEGLAAVAVPNSQFRGNGKIGYIDRMGKYVIPPQFNGYAGQFINGLASVEIMFEKDIQQPISNPPPNSSPEALMEFFLSQQAPSEFPYDGGKYAYINQEGHVVWEEIYD
ncbi:MAG: WG repeat-containing protein [Myxacorys chilensis ATA2-1-KO14]|nr:WG repeat-containing protein [Myxacorys chilensis ATA2-1-KO14]